MDEAEARNDHEQAPDNKNCEERATARSGGDRPCEDIVINGES